MIPSATTSVNLTLPNGEKLEPKSVGAKMQGMFVEMMLKSMEDSIDAEDGLFGKSASSEIYRGLLREHMGKALSEKMKSPFDNQLQKKLDDAMPVPTSAPALPTDALP